MTRGNPFSEILLEIEDALWEHDERVDHGIASPYQYDNDSFRACAKIFMSAFLWKIWESRGDSVISEMESRAERAGSDLRKIVLEYTGIDCHELYPQSKNDAGNRGEQ